MVENVTPQMQGLANWAIRAAVITEVAFNESCHSPAPLHRTEIVNYLTSSSVVEARDRSLKLIA